MSEQRHTSHWQEWRLRLRALQGWGCDAPELRQWARFYARGVVLLPVFMLAELALSLVIFDVFPRLGIGAAQPSLAMRRSLSLLVVGLLLMVVFVYLYLRHSARAEAGAHQPLATHNGSCFATIQASPQFFALIGPAREQAQWFCLPIEWDTVVAPGSDRYELTVNPATGYVEWLRRTGAEPRELRQESSAQTDADDTAPTDSEGDAST